MLELVISWDGDRDALRPQWRVTAYGDGNYLDDWDLWDGDSIAAPDDNDAELIAQAMVEAEEQLGRRADSVTVNRRFVPSQQEYDELQEWVANGGSLDDEFCR